MIPHISKISFHFRLLVLLYLIFYEAFTAPAQFTNFTTQAGIVNINEETYDGNGCSFVDINGDGYDDITLANGSNDPQIYLNNGNNTFTQVNLGIFNTSGKQAKMVLWADYDNDCDQDLLCTYNNAPVQLWQNNGNLSFTNVAPSCGLTQQWVDHFGASWGDINNDGFLDLFLCKYMATSTTTGYAWISHMFLNNGNGTFTDITPTAFPMLTPCPTFQSVFFDFDHDGYQDIFIINDRVNSPNELYRNNGNLTFSPVPNSGLHEYIYSMSATFDDFDNDSDLDIYVTNASEGNKLYKNNNNGTWTEGAETAGVATNLICWGAMWLDYDNNSWQDLFVGTTIGNYTSYQNYFFINNQNGTFTLNNAATGILGDLSPTFACAMGDLDNDGYYEFVTQNNSPHPSMLWKNNGGSNKWLGVTCNGIISNRNGIGTWIECYAGGNKYVRYTHSGENFIGQNSRKEIFGLGNINVVDSLKLYWLSGVVDTYYNLPANQHLTLTEGNSFDHSPFLTPELNGPSVICSGQSTQIAVAPYSSYLWNNGAQTQQLVVNTPGSYYVQVTDACNNTLTSSSVVIIENYLPQLTVDLFPISCQGMNDATAILQPGNYTLTEVVWNDGYTGLVHTNLGPGTYLCTYTDTQGCTGTSSPVVVEEGPQLTAEVITGNVLCHGQSSGSATVELADGLTIGNTFWYGANPLQLSAGDYTVSVTSTSGCTIELNFSISQPEPLNVTIYHTDQLTDGTLGTAWVEIAGGTPPYNVQWSTSETGNFIVGLTAGFYSALVTDSNGCISDSQFMIELLNTVDEVQNSNLSVYPIPAEDVLHLKWPSHAEGGNLFITDFCGRRVKSLKIGNSLLQSIDIRELPTGIYVLQWLNGQNALSAMFFKQ